MNFTMFSSRLYCLTIRRESPCDFFGMAIRESSSCRMARPSAVRQLLYRGTVQAFVRLYGAEALEQGFHIGNGTDAVCVGRPVRLAIVHDKGAYQQERQCSRDTGESPFRMLPCPNVRQTDSPGQPESFPGLSKFGLQPCADLQVRPQPAFPKFLSDSHIQIAFSSPNLCFQASSSW